MDIKDINFAIDILSHPQCGDESDINEALKFAIESLKACKEVLEQQSTLEKIRAEIEQLPTSECTETCRVFISAHDFQEDVLEIFDKYKIESEDNE